MTILASVNLNKRFNSQETKGRLGRWLSQHRAEVFLAQEPWKASPTISAHVGDWVPVGGNSKVNAWIQAHLRPPAWEMVEEYCQRLELGYFAVFNIYLDAYECERRAAQLDLIRQRVLAEGDRPILIVGDFNIAPEPADGLVNDAISDFNTEVDRGALHQLLTTCSLVDLGRDLASPRWTIERQIAGKDIRFRCDLALASDYIASSIGLRLDHATRKDAEAFTDHSGILLEVPVTIAQAEHQMVLFPVETDDVIPPSGESIRPEKTAMHRSGPSSVALRLDPILEKASIGSVLDYGCGYGEDVRYYRASGLEADGYDPYAPFGWPRRPQGTFDLVTVIFVLNVLPDPWARLTVIQEAAKHVSPTGLMVVATRSPEEIQGEAKTKHWKAYNDGYWSHEGKKTFQHGLSREELLALAKRAGFAVSPLDTHVIAPAGSTCVVLQRKS